MKDMDLKWSLGNKKEIPFELYNKYSLETATHAFSVIFQIRLSLQT